MPTFALQVARRSLATVYVEATDEDQAKLIFEQSGHLPDADQIETNQVLNVTPIDPLLIDANDEVMNLNSVD